MAEYAYSVLWPYCPPRTDVDMWKGVLRKGQLKTISYLFTLYIYLFSIFIEK